MARRKEKDDNFNMKLAEETLQEFKAAVRVLGASMSGFIHQYMVKTTYDVKEKHAAAFGRALADVIEEDRQRKEEERRIAAEKAARKKAEHPPDDTDPNFHLDRPNAPASIGISPPLEALPPDIQEALDLADEYERKQHDKPTTRVSRRRKAG